MNKQEFYDRCEEILNSGHEYQEIWKNERRSGRWGPREPGNGRFKGYGLVRWFGPSFIQINLYHPWSVNVKCETSEAALLFLEHTMEFYRINMDWDGG